jgi:hypothetical protein
MLAPVQVAEQGRWVIGSQETGRIRVGFLRKRDPDAGRETTTSMFYSSGLDTAREINPDDLAYAEIPPE